MINAIRVAKPKAFAAWLEITVKSSPVSENSFHLIHKIRMVSRAETGEDITDVRGVNWSHSVTTNTIANRINNDSRHLFIDQNQQDQKG